MPPSWQEAQHIEPTNAGPVGVLVAPHDTNVLSYALSVNVTVADIAVGVEEETCLGLFQVSLLGTAMQSDGPAEVSLRLDARPVHFGEALEDVTTWWESQLAHSVLPTPDAAYQAVYSTWYTMHQRVTPARIWEQATLAKRIGCDVLIVDDGWQTEDSRRGYAYCGDWQPSAAFADMQAHVKEVQSLGLKYLLWYALPLLGKNSSAYQRLADKTLRWAPELQAYVLDPRFAEVRAHLIEVVVSGARDWRLDGLKLDFLDRFAAGSSDRAVPGTDCRTVAEGTERLLREIVSAAAVEQPDILIEFRQSYTGPRMWQYANLFRATDCPFDIAENRVRTIDVRLTAGGRATHADMLMWDLDGSPESAAMQLISVLFSAPQISVPLDQLPQAHRTVLTFWLGLMAEYREVLQHGSLRPSLPDMRYPVVTANSGDVTVAAVYADVVVRLDDVRRDRYVIVNGSARPDVTVAGGPAGQRVLVRSYDCCGTLVAEREWVFGGPVSALAIPSAGVAVLTTLESA